MKKSLRILSLALAVLLACSITVTACADTCYQVLKGTLSEADNPLHISSSAQSVSFGLNNKLTAMWYALDEERLYLVTKDEGVVYDNVKFAEGVYAIYALCGIWDTMADCLESGYSLMLGITNGSIDDGVWVSSAAEAQNFRTQLEEFVSNNN